MGDTAGSNPRHSGIDLCSNQGQAAQSVTIMQSGYGFQLSLNAVNLSLKTRVRCKALSIADAFLNELKPATREPKTRFAQTVGLPAASLR